MTETKLPPPKAASQLVAGDRIAVGFLPTGEAADVVFVLTYPRETQRWTLVVSVFADGEPDTSFFLAGSTIPLERAADASGLSYSREADDPTPVSPARVPLHTGSVVDGDGLVVDVDRALPAGVVQVGDGRVMHQCCGKLDDLPHRNFCEHYRPGGEPEHYETRVWVGEGPGSCGAECACELGLGGFDTLEDASKFLAIHIAASADPAAHMEAAHVAALDEDNERAKAAVIASLRPGEDGRITNPNLAQFLAGKEYERREAAYFLGLEESATHYPAPGHADAR